MPVALSSGPAVERPVGVLLVYAETRIVPAHIARDEAFRTTLHAGPPRGVFLYTIRAGRDRSGIR
jgi:hypothetical protein